MKIVFVGCVEIGYTVLESIYQQGWSVDLVITLPVASSGKTSGFIDFHPLAEMYHSKVIESIDLKSTECRQELKQLEPDLLICCGWQRLIPDEVLELPIKGCIGFHSSLLPKYRGRAPVNWAIILGEKETGVTLFYLNSMADTGDIITQKSFPITLEDDCHTIYKKSANACCQMLVNQLPLIEHNAVKRIHNPSASYPAYPKRTAEQGLIDFQRPSLDVFNWIRALTKPYPGAFYYEDGKKIVVWNSKMGIVSGQNVIFKNTLDGVISLIDVEIHNE
jgi:methionyl-tRNA formyltransferase